MTKAIVSVKCMLANLNLLADQDEYEVTFQKGLINIGNVAISCESQYYDRVFVVNGNRIRRLIKVFSLLEEQPATIAIDNDSWLYIKEAIL